MFRNLFLLINCVVFSGCVLYVTEDPHSPRATYEHDYASEIWIVDAYVECLYSHPYYEQHPNDSVWYAEVWVDAAYSYDSHDVDVEIYFENINGVGQYEAAYAGSGVWTATFSISQNDCFDSHFFELTAADRYGSYDIAQIYW